MHDLLLYIIIISAASCKTRYPISSVINLKEMKKDMNQFKTSWTQKIMMCLVAVWQMILTHQRLIDKAWHNDKIAFSREANTQWSKTFGSGSMHDSVPGITVFKSSRSKITHIYIGNKNMAWKGLKWLISFLYNFRSFDKLCVFLTVVRL